MGLKLENVTKKYVDKTAVDNISFSIDKPGVFGLLGTNGAGKTTTIRMILGILKRQKEISLGMERKFLEKTSNLDIYQKKEEFTQNQKLKTN